MTVLSEWVVPDWPAPAVVNAFTTTRAGGVSQHGFASMNLGFTTADSDAATLENRRRLESVLPSDPGWLSQVHGNGVVARHLMTAQTRPNADAVWTHQPNLVCAVQTADCLPILFCDRQGQHVAACHAGWRGLANGVIEATLSALPVQSDDVFAWVGPGISVKAYEVGEAFRAQFQAVLPWLNCSVTGGENSAFISVNGNIHANLVVIARAILTRANVAQVYGGNFCTYTDSERFYSHRRNPRTGRMATVIWTNRST